ncbi:hypothetical protein [Haloplanus aerogenes]|uniref:Uncharacterized protein n=1 Tax=Haloplanus aerogenes TaxID=660522 RepID=A0A3M0DR68_9EURY|nr:hypothetical protein [Haloplanus aerogenes]AZH24216.1 hypothetical protein DU502_01980 [Haloplanus aerogenes]RMB24158.1 hypothetical protein ATH50_1398 [Haloplanus aerogenes]
MTDSPDDSSDATETPSDGDIDTPGGISKRTLIRLLVGFGIGIPLLVEGLTFLGLLEEQFGGGDEDSERTATATDVAESGVAVGDDLLPETDRSETLVSAVLREVDGDRWPLSLTVEVENTGDTDYEFQLLAVHLDDGRSVSGRTTTDRLAPGERRVISAEWSIPAGSTPRAVDAVALVYPDSEASETPRETGGNRTQSGDGDGSVETIERRVDLAKIPVRGG